MFTQSLISSCFAGLLGFEQSYNSEHPLLDEDLTSSASGSTINSLHPLLTYDNILAVVEQFSRVNVRVYAADTTYKKNDIVKKDDDVYQSLVDANLNQAVTNAAKWRKTNLLSAYLRRVYNASSLKLFNQVFTEKKLYESAKSLLGSVSLFDGVGNVSGRITPQSRMVGFRISLSNPDTVAVLHSIGLQIDTIQSLTVYLFHSSSNTPLKTFELNQTKSVQNQWHNVEAEVLGYMSDTAAPGGVYYLVYYEDDLTGMAIKKDMNWLNPSSCGSCSEAQVNSTRFAQRSRFVDVEPFYVNENYYTVGELWDADREIYDYDSNYGLNLQISVQCDVTNWLCQNKLVFTHALGLQITNDLLQEMTFSLRDNQKNPRIAGLAAVALDNQEGGQYGEQKKLSQAIKAISFDLSGLSSVCLPCSNANGYTKRSVWG